MLKLKCQYFSVWCEELTHLKRPWCWERLKVGGEGDDRGWDGWMTSLTRWTWVWVSSRSWWWTGKPGVLQSMGSQRVTYDWVTELNWTEAVNTPFLPFLPFDYVCVFIFIHHSYYHWKYYVSYLFSPTRELASWKQEFWILLKLYVQGLDYLVGLKKHLMYE